MATTSVFTERRNMDNALGQSGVWWAQVQPPGWRHDRELLVCLIARLVFIGITSSAHTLRDSTLVKRFG